MWHPVFNDKHFTRCIYSQIFVDSFFLNPQRMTKEEFCISEEVNGFTFISFPPWNTNICKTKYSKNERWKETYGIDFRSVKPDYFGEIHERYISPFLRISNWFYSSVISKELTNWQCRSLTLKILSQYLKKFQFAFASNGFHNADIFGMSVPNNSLLENKHDSNNKKKSINFSFLLRASSTLHIVTYAASARQRLPNKQLKDQPLLSKNSVNNDLY
jgi:hypothetical protein